MIAFFQEKWNAQCHCMSNIEEHFQTKSMSRLPAINSQTPWPEDISMEPPRVLPE